MILVLCIDPHSHGHSHGGGSSQRHHGHSHSVQPNGTGHLDAEKGVHVVDVDPPKDNINIRAAFIHAIGDLLQSVGVFIAALVIYFVVSSILLCSEVNVTRFFSLMKFSVLSIVADLENASGDA